MNAIITGARGTVGQALAKHLRAHGHAVFAWDRDRVAIDDYAAMKAFVQDTKANVLYHLAVPSRPTGRENENWLVNEHWPSELAWIAREVGCRFIFTSSVMVYTDHARGPFTPQTVPDAVEGYGAEKLRTENRVLQQNPAAVVARLGWQIGDAAGSNNMIEYLENTMRQESRIAASRKWYPACSFVHQTAGALERLAEMPGGIYLVDANRRWNFYEIVCELNKRRGSNWIVEANDDFIYDQRMIDDRVAMPSLF